MYPTSSALPTVAQNHDALCQTQSRIPQHASRAGACSLMPAPASLSSGPTRALRSALCLPANLHIEEAGFRFVPIADIVCLSPTQTLFRYTPRFADINAVGPRNGLQVIHRPGALGQDSNTARIGNAALYTCTLFSTIRLNTRSVTGQIATQIPNRSA
jgi:hypothetical protein